MANTNFFKNKKVLITGGLGFIGSNLAIKLIEVGANVTILDSLLPEYGGNKFNIFPIKNKVSLKLADLRSETVARKLVRGKQILFNLAGTLSHVDSMTDPFTDLDVNCRAQLHLLEACRKENKDIKIIFAGKALYSPVDEKHPQEPTDINGINSIAAEKYHLLYTRIHGVNTVSLRMTNTFGPRHQMKHSKQGILNWFIRLLMDGKTVQLYGSGSQIRDVNYVDDVVDALLIAARNPKSAGQVYNLGGQPITLLLFVKKVISMLNKGSYSLAPFPRERKVIEVGNYVADIKKIKQELNWQPKRTVDQGIKETIDFYQKNRKYYWQI